MASKHILLILLVKRYIFWIISAVIPLIVVTVSAERVRSGFLHSEGYGSYWVQADRSQESGENTSPRSFWTGEEESVASIEEEDLASHPQVLDFIDRVSEKYREVSRERVIRLFRQVSIERPLQTRLSNSIRSPAPEAMAWESYRDQFVNPERIAGGIAFYKKYKKLLQKVSKEFSVPVSIILAALGMESNYGLVKYPYPIFSSLVINSFFNDHRSKFYLQQLEYFVVWSQRNDWADKKILEIHGSYSGEIGPAQFIPFSVYHYGYDFDGNGKVDMLESYPDILGSIANYYRKNGWRNERKIITAIDPPCESSKDILSLTNEENTSLCWKKEHNFKVILRYNHSDFYALSLYLLSRALVQEIDKNQ